MSERAIPPFKYTKINFAGLEVLVYASENGIGQVTLTDPSTGEKVTIDTERDEHTETKDFEEGNERVIITTRRIKSAVMIRKESKK